MFQFFSLVSYVSFFGDWCLGIFLSILGHLGSFWLFFVPSVGCSLRRSKCQARKGKFLFPALSCFDKLPASCETWKNLSLET